MAVMMNPVVFCQFLHYAYLQGNCSLNFFMASFLISKKGIILFPLSTCFDYSLFIYRCTWSTVGLCHSKQTTHFPPLLLQTR